MYAQKYNVCVKICAYITFFIAPSQDKCDCIKQLSAVA